MNWKLIESLPFSGIGISARHFSTLQPVSTLRAASQHFETVGIDIVDEVLVRTVRIGVGKEIVIDSYLGVRAVVGIHPVDRGALDLAAVSGIAAAAFRIIFAEDLDDISVLVLAAAGAGDEIRPLQTDLKARIHPLELRRRDFHKVVSLNEQITGETDLACSVLRTKRIVLHREKLCFPLGIICDRQLHGVQDCHHAASVFVQIVAQATLKQRPVDGGIDLGHADLFTERADRTRGIAAAAQTAQRRHPGIVPTGNAPLFNELAQLSLGHDRIVDAETGKLDLTGLDAGDRILQRAERVGDALKRILDRVGKVVHREDAPFGPLTVMLNIADPVKDRIAHVEVAALQIDLGAQCIAPLFKLAVLHALKEIQTLLDRAIAPGRDSGVRRIAAVFAELLRCQLADSK